LPDGGGGGAGTWLAAPAATFSAGAAIVSSVQASRQAGIAARKLKFDLFAKRLEAWETINATIEARMGVVSAMRSEAPEERDGGDARRQFWHLRRQMRFLFPGEVGECLNRIEAALLSYQISAVSRGHYDMMPGPERAAAVIAHTTTFAEQTMGLYQLQEELMFLVAPHMEQFERTAPPGPLRRGWDWGWGRT
jgi:hypothetical protein